MRAEKIIRLRMQNSTFCRRIPVVQGDTARTFRFILEDITLDGTEHARIYARKPSGAEIYDECDVIGSNEVIFTPETEQIFIETGIILAEIRVAKGEKLVTSYSFEFEVRQSMMRTGDIPSSDEFNALERAIEEAKGLHEPEFTEAGKRENIVSGETMQILFGKIKKWFTDLGALITKIGNKDISSIGDGTVTGAITDLDKRNTKNTSDIDVERKRIDNIAKLPEGSTAGDAELADIRVAADGTSYDTAGESVRGQINQIDQKYEKETSSLKEDLGDIAVIGFQYLNPDVAEQKKFYTGYGNISEVSDSNYLLYPILSLPKGKYYLTNVSEIFTYFEDGTQLTEYHGYDKKASTLELSEATKIAITGYTPLLDSYVALSNVEVSSDVYGVISIVIIGDDISKRTSTLENKISTLENRHIVTVGNGKDFQTIKSAVESITDSSKQNVYDIYIDDGIYEEYAITLPDYVNLIGASWNREKCIIRGELPDSATEDEITVNSTINLMDSNTLENLTITAKNLRYPIHSESGGTHIDWTQILNNCHVEHFGNTSPNNKWTSYHAWGEGASSGAYAEFNNCVFKSPAEPWYVHEFAHLPDIPKPYHHVLNNCRIINTTISNIASWLSAVKIDNTKNSEIINTIDFNNCNFYNGEIAINDVCAINVNIHGGNNAAIRFENNCPDTDYTHIKTYVGEVGITRNTVLKYVDGINLLEKATASTPAEMIAGIATQDCEPNSLVKIIKGTYVNKTGNVGQNIYCDDNGQLAYTGTIVIGTCYGEFSLIN